MIIGITGPSGAGKDTAANYVAQIVDGVHVSGGDILREMLTTIGLEPKKSALGDFGTFIRTHYGLDMLLQKVIEKSDPQKHLVVSGFRAVEEANLIKDRRGIVIYIDAQDNIRHERILARQRSDDNMTSEMLQKIDDQERATPQPLAQNLEAIKAVADVIVENNTTVEALYRALDDAARQYVQGSDSRYA